MSVWRRFDGHGFPSLLTTNVEGRRPTFRNPAAAKHLVEVIRQVEIEEAVNLIAYVVMPDHMHLVVWLPPSLSSGRVMKMIKGRFAREYQAKGGEEGKLLAKPIPREGASLRRRAFGGGGVCPPQPRRCRAYR